MKWIITIITVAAASLFIAEASDKPISFSQLPPAAQSFISMNLPEEKISYVTVDDDFLCPDYTVMFANGTKVEFKNNGALEKIESLDGVPADIVPIQLREYVRLHYPASVITGYETGRKTYEIELSNRLDLKFNINFNLIEIDD